MGTMAPPGLDEMILHSKIEKKYQGLIGSNPWRWGNPRHLLGIHNEWEVTWDVTVIMVNKYMVNTFWLGNVLRALFRHLDFQKWSEREVLFAFWLGSVLCATTACNSSSLIWPHAWLRSGGLACLVFDPPEPQKKKLQLIRGAWKLILGPLNICLVDNYEVNKLWYIMHLRYF